ncbi:hypothetical protein OTU49_013081, partial [Cherax quadricarinatus]
MEEEEVGGMVPGPRGAVGGKTKDHSTPSQPSAATTPVLPPAPPCHRSTLHHVTANGTRQKVHHSCHILSILMPVEVVSCQCPITNEYRDYFQLYFDEPIMNLIVT